ncbi:hypothetical protein OE88DRAFT_1293986 [Heliocybe sulcata]|uniref:Uncharacterized protein n=1 Tax=Heliocybe sulcata TaxID=5364 RepID=A0A5C3NGR4_9AGAM|nr:hypothetical protein OE88DRAFT_1293986 [Heliocybe sulcata]
MDFSLDRQDLMAWASSSTAVTSAEDVEFEAYLLSVLDKETFTLTAGDASSLWQECIVPGVLHRSAEQKYWNGGASTATKIAAPSSAVPWRWNDFPSNCAGDNGTGSKYATSCYGVQANDRSRLSSEWSSQSNYGIGSRGPSTSSFSGRYSQTRPPPNDWHSHQECSYSSGPTIGGSLAYASSGGPENLQTGRYANLYDSSVYNLGPDYNSNASEGYQYYNSFDSNSYDVLSSTSAQCTALYEGPNLGQSYYSTVSLDNSGREMSLNQAQEAINVSSYSELAGALGDLDSPKSAVPSIVYPNVQQAPSIIKPKTSRLVIPKLSSTSKAYFSSHVYPPWPPAIFREANYIPFFDLPVSQSKNGIRLSDIQCGEYMPHNTEAVPSVRHRGRVQIAFNLQPLGTFCATETLYETSGYLSYGTLLLLFGAAFNEFAQTREGCFPSRDAAFLHSVVYSGEYYCRTVPGCEVSDNWSQAEFVHTYRSW